jgi:hypothetical protein
MLGFSNTAGIMVAGRPVNGYGGGGCASEYIDILVDTGSEVKMKH